MWLFFQETVLKSLETINIFKLENLQTNYLDKNAYRKGLIDSETEKQVKKDKSHRKFLAN